VVLQLFIVPKKETVWTAKEHGAMVVGNLKKTPWMSFLVG